MTTPNEVPTVLPPTLQDKMNIPEFIEYMFSKIMQKMNEEIDTLQLDTFEEHFGGVFFEFHPEYVIIWSQVEPIMYIPIKVPIYPANEDNVRVLIKSILSYFNKIIHCISCNIWCMPLMDMTCSSCARVKCIKIDTTDVCSICLDTLNSVNSIVYETKCHHQFHYKCISNVIQRFVEDEDDEEDDIHYEIKCPNCRRRNIYTTHPFSSNSLSI